MSVKELSRIYQKKCSKELNRCREILEKKYTVVDIFELEYYKGVIYVDSLDFYYEIHIYECEIENDCASCRRFKSMELLLLSFRELMATEYFALEEMDEVMKVINMLVKIHHEKQEMEEDISLISGL
jgi:hypothetical protein